MRISDISIRSDASTQTLSGKIDDFDLWFRFPNSLSVSQRGDPFLVAALLPSMLRGESIELPDSAPVSPTLLTGLAELQEIFCKWDKRFKRVTIYADAQEAPVLNDGVASFFSGGVDGCFTFWNHKSEITDLLFVHGVDIQFNESTIFDEAFAANSEFAMSQGKRLSPIVTNIRQFCHPRGTPWTIFHGAGLASFGLALSFPKVYIAATHTYAELFPWGSHPLTDRLWSTEATQFVHDGAQASRSEKVRAIAARPEILRLLRVCWRDISYNCGDCEKCVRTRIALHLLDVETPTLRRLKSTDPIKQLTIWDENDLAFFVDNLNFATEIGDKPIAAALRHCVRKYEFRRTMRHIDQLVLGGRLQAWHRRSNGQAV